MHYTCESVMEGVFNRIDSVDRPSCFNLRLVIGVDGGLRSLAVSALW